MKNNQAEVSLEERKIIQLEMLDEIDQFCRANNLRYSLAFGTLLGAIRHKGYIPWDDDVDIMMPLPDLLRFKQNFKSDNLQYCDVDTCPHFSYPFSRIAHKATYNRQGFAVSYGVCIDLYVMIALPQSEVEQNAFFSIAEKLQNKRLRLVKWRSMINRHTFFPTIPGYDNAVIAYRDYLLFNSPQYGSTDYYYIIAGLLKLRNRMIYTHDLFDQMIEVEFEGRHFLAIKDYDEFLTLRYGDYMTPPPENQRVPYHGGHYYWKQ